MAANPLPVPEDNPPVLLPNAATATTVNAIPTQEIVWQNDTLFAIQITVQSVLGHYPFAVNSFSVPGVRNQTVGTHVSFVLAGTPVAQYPFTRSGEAPMGSGKIVVLGDKP